MPLPFEIPREIGLPFWIHDVVEAMERADNPLNVLDKEKRTAIRCLLDEYEDALTSGPLWLPIDHIPADLNAKVNACRNLLCSICHLPAEIMTVIFDYYISASRFIPVEYPTELRRSTLRSLGTISLVCKLWRDILLNNQSPSLTYVALTAQWDQTYPSDKWWCLSPVDVTMLEASLKWTGNPLDCIVLAKSYYGSGAVGSGKPLSDVLTPAATANIRTLVSFSSGWEGTGVQDWTFPNITSLLTYCDQEDPTRRPIFAESIDMIHPVVPNLQQLALINVPDDTKLARRCQCDRLTHFLFSGNIPSPEIVIDILAPCPALRTACFGRTIAPQEPLTAGSHTTRVVSVLQLRRLKYLTFMMPDFTNTPFAWTLWPNLTDLQLFYNPYQQEKSSFTRLGIFKTVTSLSISGYPWTTDPGSLVDDITREIPFLSSLRLQVPFPLHQLFETLQYTPQSTRLPRLEFLGIHYELKTSTDHTLAKAQGEVALTKMVSSRLGGFKGPDSTGPIRLKALDIRVTPPDTYRLIAFKSNSPNPPIGRAGSNVGASLGQCDEIVQRLRRVLKGVHGKLAAYTVTSQALVDNQSLIPHPMDERHGWNPDFKDYVTAANLPVSMG